MNTNMDTKNSVFIPRYPHIFREVMTLVGKAAEKQEIIASIKEKLKKIRPNTSPQELDIEANNLYTSYLPNEPQKLLGRIRKLITTPRSYKREQIPLHEATAGKQHPHFRG